jgi:hypothetical protein
MCYKAYHSHPSSFIPLALKATLLCEQGRFKYSHPKCATFIKIDTKAKKIGI